jgi:hypothetical protein
MANNFNLEISVCFVIKFDIHLTAPKNTSMEIRMNSKGETLVQEVKCIIIAKMSKPIATYNKVTNHIHFITHKESEINHHNTIT